MRIPDWTPEQLDQPQELVDTILARRGGSLLNLDKALLWSEPVAAGWNVYMRNVRTGLSAPRKLCELGICAVALLTGAHYEYHHHAPDYLKAGGTQAELDGLKRALELNPADGVTDPALGEISQWVVQYSSQMTLRVKVDEELFKKLQTCLNTTEIVELTTTIAAYNMVARILVALEIAPEEK
jgi:alkylhydroperoxidase family enzyme